MHKIDPITVTILMAAKGLVKKSFICLEHNNYISKRNIYKMEDNINKNFLSNTAGGNLFIFKQKIKFTNVSL